MDLTKEQQQAIGRQKTTSVYEKTTDLINVETGELLRRQNEQINKISVEPDYIKLYYKTMLAFNGMDDIPLDFVISISQFISWSNDGSPMTFTNSKLVRETIAKQCGIRDSMYTKYLKRCTENGLLIPQTGYRGSYVVNPFFVAKGKWDSIRTLRAQFDYNEGRWTRIMEEEVPNG